MKKFNSEKIVHAMSFALFVLMLTEAYIVHEDEIKESISRLKAIIESKKGEQTDGQQTAEN
ncbi:MAG: hypothetical protein UHL70_01605 [Acutalibacteraceae bacterium]|nr:hypothetical protein [Acutalibacteraceae bacterium]